MIPNKNAPLFLETEFLNQSRVTALVVRLEVAEVYASVSDHLEKASARMEILWVLLEVLCKLVNLLRKDCYLHIRRAGVSVVYRYTLYNSRFLLGGKHR